MKVFFDTNVYVAEALLGEAAEVMIEATSKASWRIFSSSYVLDETQRVMTERLGCSSRFAHLTPRRAPTSWSRTISTSSSSLPTRASGSCR